MSPLDPGAATLPRGFRYLSEPQGGPKTPEPLAPGEEMPPSPPRRLKLKRRVVSNQLHAPTQQFLASVAAADMPIPSIEEPDLTAPDEQMAGTLPEIHLQSFNETEDDDSMDIYQRFQVRSPPRTPALNLAPSPRPEGAHYPDWSVESVWSNSDLESSPEYESSRPSTAFSTQTSTTSLFSQYTHASEHLDFKSPDLESADINKFDLQNDDVAVSRETSRKAPWTKAMSDHLWSTYLLYLQDPRVTPVRLGKSCIPPHGVCMRVAREARRSWKGANGLGGTRSGSSTPTAETSKPYIQWPHTCAATRAHLRELCKLYATKKPGRQPYMSHSPTPFNRAANRRWNRRSTPARSPSVFSAQDMAMSLTLSTAEPMQLQGPLAQITNSAREPTAEPAEPDSEMATSGDPFVDDHPRLASPPLIARSYGPSSGSSLAADVKIPRQSHTVGPRKLLMSPVRLSRSRSGTQKRRSVKPFEDQSRKRPSLAAALWQSLPDQPSDASLAQTPGVETAQASTTVVQQSTSELAAATLDDSTSPRATTQLERPFVVSASSASPPTAYPARLGSPFSSTGSSHSFPNRLSQPPNLHMTALRRPFATVQQPSESDANAPSRTTLASRLAYIDQRLKEFRNRSNIRRRSQSPL